MKLDVKELVKRVLQNYGIEYIELRNFALGSSFNHKSAPMDRKAVIIPTYFNINSATYNVSARTVTKNTTTTIIPNMPTNTGSWVSSGSVDLLVLILPIQA